MSSATLPTPPQSSSTQPVPEGMQTVTPHLVCKGALSALSFYREAFGAVELIRVPGPADKLIHACIRIGTSAVMLIDEFPEWCSLGPKTRGGTSVTLHLYVENADAFFAHAVKAGATPIMPPQDMFWGDRYGVLEDPFGHRWAVATHIRDVTPEEIQRAAMQNPCGGS